MAAAGDPVATPRLTFNSSNDNTNNEDDHHRLQHPEVLIPATMCPTGDKQVCCAATARTNAITTATGDEIDNHCKGREDSHSTHLANKTFIYPIPFVQACKASYENPTDGSANTVGTNGMCSGNQTGAEHVQRERQQQPRQATPAAPWVTNSMVASVGDGDGGWAPLPDRGAAHVGGAAWSRMTVAMPKDHGGAFHGENRSVLLASLALVATLQCLQGGGAFRGH